MFLALYCSLPPPWVWLVCRTAARRATAMVFLIDACLCTRAMVDDSSASQPAQEMPCSAKSEDETVGLSLTPTSSVRSAFVKICGPAPHPLSHCTGRSRRPRSWVIVPDGQPLWVPRSLKVQQSAQMLEYSDEAQFYSPFQWVGIEDRQRMALARDDSGLATHMIHRSFSLWTGTTPSDPDMMQRVSGASRPNSYIKEAAISRVVGARPRSTQHELVLHQRQSAFASYPSSAPKCICILSFISAKVLCSLSFISLKVLCIFSCCKVCLQAITPIGLRTDLTRRLGR